LMLVFYVDAPLEAKARQILENKFGKETAEKYMDILNVPMQDNFYKQEEYDLVTTDDLSVHVKKYEWLNSRYGQEVPYTIEEAKEKLEKIDKDKFLADWKKEKEHLSTTIQEVKAKLDPDDAHVIDMMQFLIYYRTQRTDIMNKSLYLFLPALKKLAEEKNLTFEQLLHCTKDEVLNNDIPSENELKERMKGWGVIKTEGVFRVLVGEEVDELRKDLAEDFSGIDFFKGNTACKGIVKGFARIIHGRADFDKINEGDILVTSMTTPNMVPIMNKASAFITDEGGITCHAAIISREMKKPCIIGTKIATQVLKDGDEVEVDAERGIVRIISHGITDDTD